MKLYGSLNNRFEENKIYCNEIKVGTGVTEYLYSDRHAYEVVKVEDQKHVTIRKMDVERVNKNEMSDCQEYKYISNPSNPAIKVVFRNNGWYKIIDHNKEKWLKKAETMKADFKNIEVAYNYIKAMSGLTLAQMAKVESGKSVNRYVKMDISFGIMEEYFDYSF